MLHRLVNNYGGGLIMDVLSNPVSTVPRRSSVSGRSSHLRCRARRPAERRALSWRPIL